MPELNTPAPTEPSTAQLRTMLGGSPAPEAPAIEAQPEPTVAPDPPADALAAPGAPEGQTKEADSDPAAEEPDAIEEELPPAVKKRIAKEVQRTAQIDRQIAEAVSTRKAKEAELAKLTAGKSGSEPAPNTAPAANLSKPVAPDLDTFPGTYAEFVKALAKYHEDRDMYVIAQTERTVKEQLGAQQREDSLRKDWEGATEEHGADFPEHMKALEAGTPEGLQLAISGLDNWSQVAIHLAKSPDEMAALSARWDANPYAAVAELGRLEARLQQGSKPPAPAIAPARVAKTLPPPPAKVGGDASPVARIDLEKADQRTFNSTIKAYLERR